MQKKAIVLLVLLSASSGLAVKTEYWQDSESKDFYAGKSKNLVLTNFGRLFLAPAAKNLLSERTDVSLVFDVQKLPDGSLVAATGPEGKVLILKNRKWKLLYRADQPYIFSLETGKNGKIYIGTGGGMGKIIEFDSKTKKSKVIFADKSVHYIWKLKLIGGGQLLAATGPTGKLFLIDKNGSKAIFSCKQKNLLSMAVGKDHSIYLGTDSGGIIYKVTKRDGKFASRALFDAKEDEISALAIDSRGLLYASSASGKKSRGQANALLKKPLGKPASTKAGGRKSVKSADMKKGLTSKPMIPIPLRTMGQRPLSGRSTRGNAIYRIDEMGFVTEVYRDQVDISSMIIVKDKIYIGTGPKGWIFEIDPSGEKIALIARAEAGYVLSLLHAKNGEIFACTGTPGKIVELTAGLSKSGTFTSKVFDAKQITRWGVIDTSVVGSIPQGCSLTIQTRSSAIGDANDPGWSEWSDAASANKPVHILSPVARFLQYKLSFRSQGLSTPEVDKIRIAYMQNNQAPKIESVSINTGLKKPSARPASPRPLAVKKTGQKPYKFIWKAKDPNGDALRYSVFLKRIGSPFWIELEKSYKLPMLQWNQKTVPDGRYEVKVVANDDLSNPEGFGLSDQRISDEFTVDNTPPTITNLKCKLLKGNKLLIKADLADEISNIKNAWINIDSNKNWQYIPPEDELYDSRAEKLNQVIDLKDKTAPVMVTIKVEDLFGNTGFGWQLIKPGQTK